MAPTITSFSFQAEEFLDGDDEELEKQEDTKLEEGDKDESESELDVGEAADLSPQNQNLVRYKKVWSIRWVLGCVIAAFGHGTDFIRSAT